MLSLKVGFGLKTLFLFLQLALAFSIPSTLPVWKRSTPVPPTEDPFYTPPSGYESSAPGTILRSRNVPYPLALLNLVSINIQGAYQLLYRTTDSLGNPEATVTTVIVPYNPDTTKLLSYQTAEDSSWLNCAPSYGLQQGANISSSSIELLLIIAALDQGWVVNTPDYEGPQSAFTSGIQAGQATLDSIRAALESGSITGVSSSAAYQMWGYSGGSLATEWAAELQPTYAPELNFAGAALGGLVPNITSVLETINEGEFAGLIPAGIMGLYSAYPELATFIDENLVPSKAAEFKDALNQCLVADASEFANQNLFTYFINGTTTLLEPLPQAILSETGLQGTHGTPNFPLFFYKAIGDEVSPINDTDALVEKLCSQGAQIQYVRDEIGEHGTEAITGAGDALVFLKERFDGVPAATGCSVANVTSSAFNLAAIEALGITVADILLALLSQPIGIL